MPDVNPNGLLAKLLENAFDHMTAEIAMMNASVQLLEKKEPERITDRYAEREVLPATVSST